MAMSCQFVEYPNVMPGWGCCKCRRYNGLQRKVCKFCGHEPCIDLPKPEKFGLCNECGAPIGQGVVTLEGVPVGHTDDCSREK